MKKVVNVFSMWSLVACFFVFGIYIAYTRFTNMDMTETRLFVTFWKEYGLISVVYIALVLVYEFTKEKK